MMEKKKIPLKDGGTLRIEILKTISKLFGCYTVIIPVGVSFPGRAKRSRTGFISSKARPGVIIN